MAGFQYPLTTPSDPAPQSTDLDQINIVAVSRSIFTMQEFVQASTGDAWGVIASYPPMTRAQAALWRAFLAELKGRRGTFHFGDAFAETPLGTVTGTPVVNGADQTGNSLIIDGLGAGSDFLSPGDFFQMGSGLTRRMYQLIGDQVTADGGGEATLFFWPELRDPSPPDNDVIITSTPQCLFRMTENISRVQITDLLNYGIAFTAQEAL